MNTTKNHHEKQEEEDDITNKHISSQPPNKSDDNEEIKQNLRDLGVNVLEPISSNKKEEAMVEAMEAFSSFVLEEEREMCQSILEKHMSSSVGELQGGNDEYSIYRVLIANDDEEENEEDENNGSSEATAELFDKFHSSWQGKRYSKVWTVAKLRQYMLGMCERHCLDHDDSGGGGGGSNRQKKYKKLGNFMFILSFGSIHGQVRHIDNMVPNLQICLYMSKDCPSTIVYAMDGTPIESCSDLIDYWEQGIGTYYQQIKPEQQQREQKCQLPQLVKTILRENHDKRLKSKWYTKYFAFWDSLDSHMKCFGKLYQPVSKKLSLTTNPGTTLVCGGNEVHSGPPSSIPRMFAFAIGIPDSELFENEENNGEVQYSPVLLHVDLCCILFSIIDYEYASSSSGGGGGGRRQQQQQNNNDFVTQRQQEAKAFLLNILVMLIKDYPEERYDRQLGDDRVELRDWLGSIVCACKDEKKTYELVQEAVASESIFYSPDVQKRRAKKKKKKKKTTLMAE